MNLFEIGEVLQGEIHGYGRAFETPERDVKALKKTQDDMACARLPYDDRGQSVQMRQRRPQLCHPSFCGVQFFLHTP